jgi:ABC-2 type transport system ATP-binding protein
VRIAGFDLQKDAIRAKSRLCFVPDTPHLFDYLTVDEHLNFAARIYQVKGWRQRAERLLEEFELIEKRNHLPQALSRGMRQKVAICLGFLHNPSAIILDEPLTGLDPLGIRRMKDAIVKRAKEDGAAVIVSSHQLELVEEICDEVLIIRNGTAVITGTLASIRERLGAADEKLSLEAIFFRVMSAPEAGVILRAPAAPTAESTPPTVPPTA